MSIKRKPETTTKRREPYPGQTIWILGASSGIGKALAIELAGQGVRLVLSARREELLRALNHELGGHHLIIPCDAGDIASVQKAFDTINLQCPSIDRAIFMAASYSVHDGKNKDIQSIHDMIRVNFLGACNMVDCVLPVFKNQGYGQITLCASVAGYRGLPFGQPYCAGKAALINYAETLKLDLEDQNIDVKVICPGFVKTPLTDKNNFPMPMMISADLAAAIITKELRSKRFEIHFPKKFTYLMKLLRLIPNGLYFHLARTLRKKAVSKKINSR